MRDEGNQFDGEDRVDIEDARRQLDRALQRLRDLDIGDIELSAYIKAARGRLHDVIVRNRAVMKF